MRNRPTHYRNKTWSNSKLRKAQSQHLWTEISLKLTEFYWHVGFNALGRSVSACEEGDHVTAPHVLNLPTNKYAYIKTSTLDTHMLGLFAKVDLVFFMKKNKN